MAIAAAGSLETIFPASSHTLQVLLCNRHLFIISPQISSFDQLHILILTASPSDHSAILLIVTSKTLFTINILLI